MRYSERLVGVRGYAGLLTLLAALVVGPVAAEPLSFAAALVRLESHPTLEASQAQGRAATAVRDSARALRFPQVGLSGTYGRFSDPVELDLGDLNALSHVLHPAHPTIPNPVLQPESFGFATATLAWPVFT
ncbi:MAG: TolC family protein, partial [Gammaproteobacteria bacterium]